jgi:sugar phosphate isomerase/epimerase
VGYLAELKKRCEGEGVRSGLIMVDTAGALGAADAAKREAAVSSHRTWLDAAKSLGCHAMRVNARGDGAPSELLRGRVAESCAKLAEHAAKLDLNLTIENHGGPSSDPVWLAAVMKDVNSPWFGTLPDFGNFPPETDRYDAVAKLMPFAKAVSAKTHRFDAQGNELDTDYARMMRIVLDAGYRGYVGIECEGAPKAEDEPQHIRFARAILEKFRAALPPLKPLFNGKDLDGWVKVAGGEWAVDNGTILARNGVDWSTDPSRTGSWLRTEKEYGDFELFLEYSLGPKTNSGVFFRSGLEKNPAFTGVRSADLRRPRLSTAEKRARRPLRRGGSFEEQGAACRRVEPDPRDRERPEPASARQRRDGRGCRGRPPAAGLHRPAEPRREVGGALSRDLARGGLTGNGAVSSAQPARFSWSSGGLSALRPRAPAGSKPTSLPTTLPHLSMKKFAGTAWTS